MVLNPATNPGGGGITQGDPVAMQQAYETYDITVNAANEAWNRINTANETLKTTYTGDSGTTFNSTVNLWLEKFTIVINNLTAMRDALGDSRMLYITNETNNTDTASSLLNSTVGADIQNLL